MIEPLVGESNPAALPSNLLFTLRLIRSEVLAGLFMPSYASPRLIVTD